MVRVLVTLFFLNSVFVLDSAGFDVDKAKTLSLIIFNADGYRYASMELSESELNSPKVGFLSVNTAKVFSGNKLTLRIEDFDHYSNTEKQLDSFLKRVNLPYRKADKVAVEISGKKRFYAEGKMIQKISDNVWQLQYVYDASEREVGDTETIDFHFLENQIKIYNKEKTLIIDYKKES